MASQKTRQRVDQRAIGFRRCTTQKVGYRTHDEALDAAELMMQKGLVRPGCHITPYQCDKCSEWHVANRVIVWKG